MTCCARVHTTHHNLEKYHYVPREMDPCLLLGPLFLIAFSCPALLQVLLSQQFRALIPGPREHVISTGRACFRVTRAISIRNREWTDFIRLISRSRKLICTRTDEFGLIIARVRAILNETGQTPYEDRVLVRKNYCMTYWQLEDTWLIYGLCQLIPCTEYVAGY